MVYEDVTDDENENTTTIATSATSTTATTQSKKSTIQTDSNAATNGAKETIKKGGKYVPISKGQQRSMTSYFTKK